MKIQHLGIIPDGNRRWARSNYSTYSDAYLLFLDRICSVIETANQLGITTLSIYILSKENLSRSFEEVHSVLEVSHILLSDRIPKILQRTPIAVRCIGIDNIKDESLIESAKAIQTQTASNRGMTLNLLIGYNPIDEINLALSLNSNFSLSSLQIPTPVDLVIRTAGGPTRLSNFLPLQCGYANIEVLEKNFPDISPNDIENIIRSYECVNPKYGH